MLFAAGPATSSGFELIKHCESRLKEKDRQIIELLRSCLKVDEPRSYHFKPLEGKLSSSERDELAKVRAHLPGGSGPLLPSIGVPEYSVFDKEDAFIARTDGMAQPAELMASTAPLPMVRLPCRNTFSTIKAAAVQMAYSALTADAEQRESMRLWAATKHDGALFDQGSTAVLRLKFNKFRRLGSTNDEVRYRLPRDLGCSFKFPPGDRSREDMEVYGYLMNDNPSLPSGDAFFQVTSHTWQTLERLGYKSNDTSFLVSCEPHYPSFTLSSQLETVNLLRAKVNLGEMVKLYLEPGLRHRP